MGALINLHIRLHSWIWSEMWFYVVFQSELKRSIPISYQIGNWKCVKNTIAKALKFQKEWCGNLMYHFVVIQVRVLWKIRSHIEPPIKELDENHKLNVITWFFGSSPGLPSNFGISEGNFIGMAGQEGSWWMGSIINLDNSSRSKVAKNCSCWFGF